MQAKYSVMQSRRLFVLATFVALVGVACVKTRAPSVATNAPAPAFSLTDSAGKQVSLADLTANGPAVIAFYRGYW
ncbi:MAG: redoxin domain-containing protein [Polyangiaceae bacterium]|nr:redoxin domain-containing protein [Polyangiaceae bacterium]